MSNVGEIDLLRDIELSLEIERQKNYLEKIGRGERETERGEREILIQNLWIAHTSKYTIYRNKTSITHLRISLPSECLSSIINCSLRLK